MDSVTAMGTVTHTLTHTDTNINRGYLLVIINLSTKFHECGLNIQRVNLPK